MLVVHEPRNMGAWDLLDEKVIAMFRDGQTLRYLGFVAARCGSSLACMTWTT
ncbi:MAG TPA: hypothetical protein VMT00_05295 [Thermoanaerobaculia bacterium]|nr:hypothetical protein [Thermoanaerobaculia bacterium]